MSASSRGIEQELHSFFRDRADTPLVYLFGSRATQQSGPLSDVVLEESVPPTEFLERRLELIRELQERIGQKVDVVLLNEATPLLCHRAIARGKLNFSRDETYRVRFETRRVAEYLDTAYLRETYNRAFEQRVREGTLFGDREIFLRRVELIREYGKMLEELVALPEQTFTEDPDVYLKAERCLELVIQAMLDIGGHIISDRQLGQPSRYDEVFQILGKHEIITKELAEKLQGLAGLRNILVHAYLELDRGRVRRLVIDRLDQFESYVSQILESLDEEP